LGKVGALRPDEARERCQKVLDNVAHGRHPLHGLNGEGLTLGQFIGDTYVPWVKANRPRTAANTLDKLKRHFGTWFTEPLSTITVERIESWKIRRVNTGRVATTVMRDIFTLSSVLRRAVRLGKLADNPIRWVDKPRIDRRPKIRFLDQQEESRLRAALNARDAEMRAAPDSANGWREEREYELLPSRPHFGDHLTPAVLLSMNTGLRRGELLALRWESIDFSRRILTVEGGTAKSRQTRHVPLNDEAMAVLTRWREQANEGPRVFEVRTQFQDGVGEASQARHDHEISLARPPSSLCLAPGASRCTAQHGARPARSQLGSDVIAIRTLGTRPEARGGRQAQCETSPRAYPALTVESAIPQRLSTPIDWW